MLNKCCFIGNLGRDPEIRSLPNGGKVANLSIGVSEAWKNKTTGEKMEKTEWVRVTVFNENIVNVIEKYTAKGDKIYIEGKMQTRKFTDSAGVEKYVTEIILGPYDSKLVLLGGKKSSESGAKAGTESKANSGYAPATAADALDGDEIPF